MAASTDFGTGDNGAGDRGRSTEARPFVDLTDITRGFLDDLSDLRAGRITNTDARVRAQLGRELLRSVHIQLEAAKTLQVPALPAPEEEPK